MYAGDCWRCLLWPDWFAAPDPLEAARIRHPVSPAACRLCSFSWSDAKEATEAAVAERHRRPCLVPLATQGCSHR